MPRGGKRPGAGAPKGNLNAFKTGRNSLQLKAALGALLTNEDTRDLMLAIIDNQRRRRLRYQAMVLSAAKLITDAKLRRQVARALGKFLAESEN